MKRQASCCCGQLTITTKGDPVINAICHCDNCKQRTGSAFGISVYFNDSQIIEKSGTYTRYIIEDGIEQTRYFCSGCGTTLFWEASTFPGMTGIAGGCFIHELPEPQSNIWGHNQFDWLSLPEQWKTDI